MPKWDCTVLSTGRHGNPFNGEETSLWIILPRLSLQFPALVYRAIDPGSLLAYSTKVHQYHNWTLNCDGTSLMHFDTGMEGEVTPVSSMSACDIAACRASGIPVHFGAHPALARVVHIWAGRRRWRPHRRKIKQSISKRRCDEGKRLLKERDAKLHFHVHSEGTSLITWRDIRRIRASFPTNAQTLYQPKCNSFPLLNWASQDVSCPISGCSRTLPTVARHVFWACSCVRCHQELLLDRWRSLRGFSTTDTNVRAFGLELPEIPLRAWDANKRSSTQGDEIMDAKDAVFPAARELWHFAVSTTIHAIWSELLDRMEDPILLEEA